MAHARSIIEVLPLGDSGPGSDGRASRARPGGLVLRQPYHETRVRCWRGLPFRSPRAEEVRGAYGGMQPWELEGINARQAWANWRTIPRNLEGRVQGRALSAIDLC